MGLSALLLMALGLRLLGLELQPLWWDEGYSLFFATETPARLLELTSLDIHPPLYYLLLQGWMALVGIGAMQARGLSVFVGVLALPVAWQVARRAAGQRVAWAATALLALSPFHLYYSQEVRMYGLATLLALLAVAAWQRRRWGALGLATLAGLLTHYYFALLALALTLLVLLDLRAKRHTLAGPLRTLAVTVIGFLPWLLYAGPRLLRYVGGKLDVEADQPLSPLEFLPRHLVAWTVGHLAPTWEWLAWLALPFVVALTIGLWSARRRPPAPRSPLPASRLPLPAPFILHPSSFILLFALPTLATFLIGLRAPFVDARIERQLIMVLPFLLMLVACGLVGVWERWRAIGGALAALLVAASLLPLWGFWTVPRYPGEDPRGLLAQVGAAQGPGDGWLAIYPWQIGFLRAYLPHAHPTPIAADLGWDDDPAALAAGARELLTRHARLWLPAYQVKGRQFEEKLVAALRAEGVEAWNEWDGNTRLFLFGHAPDLPPLTPIGTFEGAGEGRAALGAAQAPSGVGIVPVFFEVAQPASDLRASVQLVGRDAVWGEWDGAVEAGTMRAGLAADAGTPPGDYTVHLTLYRAADGGPLERFEGAERRAPEATLGSVTVVRPPAPRPVAALRQTATVPLDVTLGDAARLVGATVPAGRWQQGDRVPLTLFWQARATTAADLRVFVQALDAGGTVRAAREVPPVNGTFSTPQWQPGDLVRDPHALDLPPDLPPGDYRLIAGLYDPATGARLAAPNGQSSVALGTLRVAERPRTLAEPPIGQPTDVPFGERARLARVQLPEPLEAGQPIALTLVWQARATGGPPLRAFAQLFRDGEQLRVSDHALDPPANAWLSGEWIVDTHVLDSLPDLPPGEYRLVVGLYDPATGARLLTPEGDWATVGAWAVP